MGSYEDCFTCFGKREEIIMKITKIQAIPLRYQYNTSIGDALSTINTRQAILVKIETDLNIYGIGEAFTYGSPMEVIQFIIDKQFAPSLIGEDPLNIEKLWNTLYWRTIANGRRGITMGAISGIDIALWDIMGKAANMPIYKLLGGFSNKIPAYASGGFYAPNKDLDGLKQEIEGYMEKGYTEAKIKIGRNNNIHLNPLKYMEYQEFSVSFDEDMKRIETARQILGKGRLIVDMNASWTSELVLQSAKELEKYNVNWIEEPIPFEDLDGCRNISREMPNIMICGFETEQGVSNFTKMIVNDVVDIVQPDIGWTGGFSETKKIATVAAAHSKAVSLHSFGSAVHFAASLHLAASISNAESIESEENFNPLKTQITTEGFVADKNMNYIVSDKPGLGIELDWDVIEKYGVK